MQWRPQGWLGVERTQHERDVDGEGQGELSVCGEGVVYESVRQRRS